MDSQSVADILLDHEIKPTLSKMTVYNTLRLLVDSNLVRSINMDDNEKRYEIIIYNHSHFKCENFHKVYDIPYGNIDLLLKQFKSFKIKEKQIFLKGYCRECQSNI